MAFGLAVWARIRQAQASPLLGGLAVIATTLVALTTLAGANMAAFDAKAAPD